MGKRRDQGDAPQDQLGLQPDSTSDKSTDRRTPLQKYDAFLYRATVFLMRLVAVLSVVAVVIGIATGQWAVLGAIVLVGLIAFGLSFGRMDAADWLSLIWWNQGRETDRSGRNIDE